MVDLVQESEDIFWLQLSKEELALLHSIHEFIKNNSYKDFLMSKISDEETHLSEKIVNEIDRYLSEEELFEVI